MADTNDTTGTTAAERAVEEHAASDCHWCELAVFDVEAPACRTMVVLVRAAAAGRERGR